VWKVPIRLTKSIQESNILIGVIQPNGADWTLKNPPNSYYYWAQYYESHSGSVINCHNEEPGAFNSGTEQVSQGWERVMEARPNTAYCVAVYLLGDNYHSPEGFAPNGGRKEPLARVWFRTPGRPGGQRSPGGQTTTGCFNHYPDWGAIRQCLYAKYGN